MAAAALSKKYLRPALIIFSTNMPVSSNGGTLWDFGTGGSTLYLTDDGRSALNITPERIGYKRRMIDGTMRSVYVADKNTFSTSWTNLPSRKTRTNPPSPTDHLPNAITSDGFGAGVDIKNWYEANYDDFWMLLVYDATATGSPTNEADLYNVFFNSFDYNIVKRGQYNDLWDVSISLVEV